MRLAFALALVLAGCAEPVELSWSVSVVDPVGCADIVAYEARIERGGCGGEPVYDELSFAGSNPSISSESVATPPALSPGRWGFRVRARDSACNYVADRCVDIDLPNDDGVVEVDLSCAASADLACAAAACEVGLCPGDPPPPPLLRWPPSGYATGTVHAVLPTQLRWFASPSVDEYQVSLSNPCDEPARACDLATEPRVTSALEMPLASIGLARRITGTRRAWAVRSCRAGLCGPWSKPRIVLIDRMHGDINGDGYSDAMIGEPEMDDGRTAILFGAPTLDMSLEHIDSTAGAGSLLGSAVVTLDLETDGFAEVLLGAPAGAGDSGRVIVGRGTRAVPRIETLDYSGITAGERFGEAIAMVGDIDADGFNDFAVGAPAFGAGGRVVLFLEQGARTQVFEHDAPGGGAFGSAITGGDLDGDGFAELVVGEPTRGAGRVLVFRGGPDGAATTPDVIEPPSAQAGLEFGGALAMLNDLDGDARADLAVAAQGWDAAGDMDQRDGRVFIYRGDGTMLIRSPVELATPSGAGGRFGASLAAGDLDGDGRSDLAIGAPGASPGGAAAIFLSDGSALPAAPDRLIDDAPAAANAGTSVGVGDVNGDGYEDLVVGAPGEGAARVYLGSAAGPPTLAAIRLASGMGRFGAAVSLGR